MSSKESLSGGDELSQRLHELVDPVGSYLDTSPHANEINLIAIRAETEQRQTLTGRIGYTVMRVVQYFRP